MQLIYFITIVAIFMLKNKIPINPHTDNLYTERSEVESFLVCYFYQVCIMLKNGHVVELKRYPEMKLDYTLPSFQNCWKSTTKERFLSIMDVDTETDSSNIFFFSKGDLRRLNKQ